MSLLGAGGLVQRDQLVGAGGGRVHAVPSRYEQLSPWTSAKPGVRRNTWLLEVVQDDRAGDFTVGVEVPLAVLGHPQPGGFGRVVPGWNVHPEPPGRARGDDAVGPVELDGRAYRHAVASHRCRPVGVADVRLVDRKRRVRHLPGRGDNLGVRARCLGLRSVTAASLSGSGGRTLRPGNRRDRALSAASATRCATGRGAAARPRRPRSASRCVPPR